MKLKITTYELSKAPRPLENFIVNKLIENNFPLKLLRKSKFDVTAYREDEIEWYGEISRSNDSNGDLIFEC